MAGPNPLANAARSAAGSLLALAVAGLIACGGDTSPAAPDPGDPSGPSDEGPDRDPDSPLECRRLGYPCAWSDVPDSVAARTVAVLDSLVRIGASGRPIPDAVAWLEKQPDLAHVEVGELALRFRLNGGAPAWAVTREVVEPRGSAPEPVHPVGDSPGQAAGRAPTRIPLGSNRADKRALVLSPFKYEFLSADEGAEVARILTATRGYDGNVFRVANETPDDRKVTIAWFRGWDLVDVVHVATHGVTICLGEQCRAMIIAAQDPRPWSEVSRDWPGRGIYPTAVLGEEAGDTAYIQVALEAEFFRSEYPNGLSNAIVYVSACETVGIRGSDLADALAGTSSVYIGWDEPVQSGHARDAALELYRILSEDGTTVRNAMSRLGSLTTNTWFDDDNLAVIALMLRHGPLAPFDHRIRETVWIEHPDNQEPLADGDALAPLGRLGDGIPDTIPYRIRVDGVDDTPDRFDLHIEIDGRAIEHPALMEGRQEDGYTWSVEGKAPLTRDLREGDRVAIRAEVHLPDEGLTEQTLTVEVVAPPPVSWVGSASQVLDSPTFGRTVVTTEVTDLVFERVEDPLWPPGAERYEVVSGRLSWSTEGEIVRFFGPNCQYAAGPFAFDVPPGSAYIEIVPDELGGPPRYNMFGSFEDRVITIATTCSDLDHTTKIQAVWMAVWPEDGRLVSADGSTIAGSKESGVNRWTWDLRRRVETQP